MGQVKLNTRYINTQTMFRLDQAHPAWEMHPDWVQALKSLDSYNLWICEVVMPIVFQWIEDNKEEVYKNIPDNLRDDIGVVIAKAFEIVEQKDNYKRGNEVASSYEDEYRSGKFDTSKVNPLWQSMSKALDDAKQRAKASDFLKILGTTIKPG